MSSQSPVTRIGIVGTGMISRCLARLISRHYDDMTVTRVLTRRPIATVTDYPLTEALTQSSSARSRPASRWSPSMPNCR